MQAHNGFPSENALRRMPTGITSQFDLRPQSSSPALVHRYHCVKSDRNVANSRKMYI